ncbi:uncharacterized protein ACB058_021424 isoform 3-T3 [Synchiropus picturatus]
MFSLNLRKHLLDCQVFWTKDIIFKTLLAVCFVIKQNRAVKMMSKKPSLLSYVRWPEPVSTKTSKPAQKRAAKESAVPTPGHTRSKPVGSSVSLPNVAFGRSYSFSSRRGELGVSSCKAGGGLKREYQGVGPPLKPSRPPARLTSCHSFSSLPNSSFPAAPFMRTSRSLSRLDQRHARDDSGSPAHLRRRHPLEKKFLNCGHLSSSDEQLREKKEHSCDEMAETSSMSGKSSSSPCSHHCSKVKKQTKDGVYNLCSMTSGMKRNWVQAVLKNVRSSPTRDITSSPTRECVCGEDLQELKMSTEEFPPPPEEVEELNPQLDRGSALSSDSASPLCSITSSSASPATSPTNYSHLRLEEDTEDASSHQAARDTETGSGSLPSLNLLPVKECPGDQLQVDKDSSCDGVEGGDKLPSGHQMVQELTEEPKELQNDHSSEVSVQELQKLNHDLHCELEAQQKIQDQARESELRRRVELLAQQAQLLVSGDATALAQVQMEQERQRFSEQRAQWERSLSSVKAQLGISEEQRMEAEVLSSKLKEELLRHDEEAAELRGQLQEVQTKLQDNEEAQAEKELRLQKHLILLQASQDRERKRLLANLSQAERTAGDLQDRLDRAEQQMERLTHTQTLSKEIEQAQQQLQEELGCTVSAVQRLRNEKEKVDRRCQELQRQLTDSEEELRKVRERLKTEETQYYNMEHSYETVSEELQLTLGKVQHREAETQEMREGYERLLDRKDQELREVLLKMEVLGNSLEETEVKLNNVLKACTCAKEASPHDEDDVTHMSITGPGDDPQRFMAVIKFLESKLFVTEEKLKDITQTLEQETSSSCSDLQIYSQLTQSRAAAQHLSLLLHSQTRQSQRFAQDTESRSRMLVGRFQVALNIVQACREKLLSSYNSTAFNVADFERQLATAVACLVQGEKDAAKQQQQSFQAIRGDGKTLQEVTDEKNPSDSDVKATVGWRLAKEKAIVEEMLAVLETQIGFGVQSLASVGDMTQTCKSLISQLTALKKQRHGEVEVSERAIRRACTEAELVYATFKLQQQFETEQEPGESNHKETSTDKDGGAAAEKSGEEDPDLLRRILTGLRGRASLLQRLSEKLTEDSRSDMNVCSEDMDDSWRLEEVKWIYLSNRLCIDFEMELKNSQEQQTASLTQEWESLNRRVGELSEDNRALREQLKQAEQKIASGETGNQKLQEDLRKVQDYQEYRTHTLEEEFQKKIKMLQQIHEDEMKHFHDYHIKCCVSKERTDKYCKEGAAENKSSSSPERSNVHLEDIKRLEEMHRKRMADLQQQHQQQVEALQKEKEQLLKEETSATMAAMVAMKRAHKEELEKSRRSQHFMESNDLSQVQIEYEKGIELLHKELELLSLQHTQKCLENSQLCQELQDERKSLMQYQRENKELKKKQRERTEQIHRQFTVNGKHGGSQVNSFYEMEVILRAKDAEMQFLRQEARTLRDELKLARKDKLHAQNKLKEFYSKSFIDALGDGCEDSEDSATWSDGRETCISSSEETLTDTNNASPMRTTDKASLTRLIRGGRSKHLNNGLSPQERMNLFETEF